MKIENLTGSQLTIAVLMAWTGDVIRYFAKGFLATTGVLTALHVWGWLS